MNTIEMKFQLPMTLSEDEVRLLLAVKLFEESKITLGQAANLAGFTKRAFIDVLDRYAVPVINYSPEELRQEVGL